MTATLWLAAVATVTASSVPGAHARRKLSSTVRHDRVEPGEAMGDCVSHRSWAVEALEPAEDPLATIEPRVPAVSTRCSHDSTSRKALPSVRSRRCSTTGSSVDGTTVVPVAAATKRRTLSWSKPPKREALDTWAAEQLADRLGERGGRFLACRDA